MALLGISIPVALTPGVRAAPTSNTFAEPVAPTPPAADADEWYGWQTLLSDGAAVALFTTAGLLSNAADHGAHDRAAAAATFWLGLGTYALGGPIVHLAHHRSRVMAKSLAMRLLLPLGGGIVGLPASWVFCRRDDGEEGLACLAGIVVVGAGVGTIAAMVIDATLLARVPRESEAQRMSFAVVPSNGGAVASCFGRF